MFLLWNVGKMLKRHRAAAKLDIISSVEIYQFRNRMENETFSKRCNNQNLVQDGPKVVMGYFVC